MQGDKKCKGTVDSGVWGGIYGLAFIGGVVFYIQHATSFWAGVLGILKAIVWPAVLMYKILELMQM
ncbi:hypothetical protein AMJ86_02230 [bacterium SM23_57]|nr:MAG: hypothetical protein AMJ86_02230 [bacterium SM23_57]